MTDPIRHQQAFDQAQRAFANGWIDMPDLDRRLAVIANARTHEQAQAAVADLADVERRIVRTQPPSPARDQVPAKKMLRIAADSVFLLMAVAFAINLIIWGVVALNNGGQYFWPVWLLIPLGVTAIPAVLVRMLGRE